MRRNVVFSYFLDKSGYLLFAAFTTIFLVLTFSQHAAFQTHALDLGYYDQALWNTAHGHWFANTLKPFPLLGSHFSPLLVLVVPLYWIWSDVRVMFVVQTLALAFSGLPLYWLAKEKWPAAAPFVLLAYYLNPSLHVAGLNQLRGTILAVPCLALALYGLVKEDRRWIVVGSVLALLSKENMSIYVAAFGAYWLVKKRDWKLGGGLVVLGLLWFFIVLLKVVPYFRGAGYPYFSQYSYLGSGLREAIQSLLRDPLIPLRTALSPERLAAAWRVAWPSGLLGLLAPSLLALSLPAFGYLLPSTEAVLYTLQDWYPVPLQPIFYTAAVVGLLWLKDRGWWRGRVARLAVVYQVTAGLCAFWLLSPVPPARHADLSRFTATAHTRLGHELLSRVPSDAVVAAQSDLLPHLAHRKEIYVYPDNLDRVEYVIVDVQSNPYPFSDSAHLNDSLQNLLADTEFDLWVEADGYYILHRADELRIRHPRQEVLHDEIALLGFDLAVADDRGEFHPLESPFRLTPGQTVRLTLYWDSLADVRDEYAVFVHFFDANGQIVGQHDSLPANGYRATSWWGPDWLIRDHHYFAIDALASPGTATLLVGMYSPYTTQRLTTRDGHDAIVLTEITLDPTPSGDCPLTWLPSGRSEAEPMNGSKQVTQLFGTNPINHLPERSRR